MEPIEKAPTKRELTRAEAVPKSTGMSTGRPLARPKPKKGKGKAKPRPSDVLRQKPAHQQAPVVNGDTANNSLTNASTEPDTPTGVSKDQDVLADMTIGLPLPGPFSVEFVKGILLSSMEHAMSEKERKAPVDDDDPDDDMETRREKARKRAAAIKEMELEEVIEKGLRRYTEDAKRDPYMLQIAANAVKKDGTEEDHTSFKTTFSKLLREMQEEKRVKNVAEGADCYSPARASVEQTQTLLAEKAGARAAIQFPEAVGDLSSAPAMPDMPNSNSVQADNPRKRKAPDLSNGAIAAKRVHLEKTLHSRDGKPPLSYVRGEGNKAFVDREWDAPPRYSTPDTVMTEMEPEHEEAREPTKHYLPRAKLVYKTRQNADEMDNLDTCHLCKGRGELLCCDGCINSFHFTCLKPALDPKKLPEGNWYCPDCSKVGVFPALLNILESHPGRDFQLPVEVRESYKDVKTSKNGSYEHCPDDPKLPKDRPRTEAASFAHNSKKYDEKGNLRLCVQCRMPAEKNKPNRRELHLCDYCPSYWHLDCLSVFDPALTHRPNHFGRSNEFKPNKAWMCPNHIEHALKDAEDKLLHKYRRPRNPQYANVTIAQDKSAGDFIEDADKGGVVHIDSEKAMIRRFVASVHEKYAREKNVEEWAKQHAAYLSPETDDSDDGDVQMDNAPSAPTRSMEHLNDLERDAVGALMHMSQQAPLPTLNPAAMLVDNLIQSKSLDLTSATNELETLELLRGLINDRVTSLTTKTDNHK